MEEAVSDIQGVNVVINETLKVQEKMIENLRKDLGTQEDMKVVEISTENNAGNSCNKYDYVASKSIYIKNHMLKHTRGHKCDKYQKTYNNSKVL